MFQIRFALLSLLPVLAGCTAVAGSPAPEPPRDPLSLALVEMDRERFRTAQLHLREAASACPGGASSVDALLLLSVLHLDPRFEGRDPETAARYAARVVWRDQVPAPDVEVARALYLAALELGAPVLGGAEALEEPAAPVGPVAGGGMMARYRTSPVSAGVLRADGSGSAGQDAPIDGLPVPTCPGIDGVRTWESLPEHPGPVLAQSIVRARAALDSLGQSGTAPVAAEDNRPEVERLRARVEQLEAELARIRRLLRGGG